jgi:hypothetical protein
VIPYPAARMLMLVEEPSEGAGAGSELKAGAGAGAVEPVEPLLLLPLILTTSSVTNRPIRTSST